MLVWAWPGGMAKSPPLPLRSRFRKGRGKTGGDPEEVASFALLTTAPLTPLSPERRLMLRGATNLVALKRENLKLVEKGDGTM